MAEKKFEPLETMHGTFMTTYNKMHLQRKPWTPGDPNQIRAVIPGTVEEVCVTDGQTVKEGDVLLIFKAMKMHNRILAPRDCTVKRVAVQLGENLPSQTVMVELE